MEPFIINDNWNEIHWVILGEQKMILGYSCIKAIGYFRGRTYTAWYTSQIPYQYGPWKLFGLSGTILEAKDDFDNVSFVAKNICYPCSLSENIGKPNEPLKKNIKEYADYSDRYLLHLKKKLQQRASERIKVKLVDKITPEYIKKHRLYHLETVYEWEIDSTKKIKH